MDSLCNNFTPPQKFRFYMRNLKPSSHRLTVHEILIRDTILKIKYKFATTYPLTQYLGCRKVPFSRESKHSSWYFTSRIQFPYFTKNFNIALVHVWNIFLKLAKNPYLLWSQIFKGNIFYGFLFLIAYNVKWDICKRHELLIFRISYKS